MDPLSILCILIGILIIATRGPMVFAPTATLRFYDRLLSTDALVRGIGIALAPFGVALIALPLGEGAPVAIVRASGWLWTAAALWLLLAPKSYRRFAHGVLDFFETSVDEAIVRILGLATLAIGVALIYVGVYVLPSTPRTWQGPGTSHAAPPIRWAAPITEHQGVTT